MAVNLAAVRAELPVLARVAYLNTGTFGPLPRDTVDALVERERQELEEGRLGKPYFDDVRDLRGATRNAVGDAIGAPASAIALTRSTSDGCNIAVASLCLRPEDEIVTTDVEHFGLLGPLHLSGARVRVASIRDRPASEALDAIAAEIGPRTRLVAVSHVAWSTGHVLPVAQLAALARDADARLLLDGAQSVGRDSGRRRGDRRRLLHRVGTEVAARARWHRRALRSPEVIEGVAVPYVCYFGQVGYDPDGAFVPAEGAARFDAGTIPAPSLDGLVRSLDFAARVGPARFARARQMTERCRELLAPRFEVVTEPGQATLVSFRVPGETGPVVSGLAERGVSVRDLPGTGWIRASAGFWTSEDELLQLVDGLAALA